MAKLDGKVALITGAAAGLGEGIASAYAKYGAKMILVDLSPAVEETAEKLRREYGAEVITAVANVADRAQMDAAAAKAVEAFGAIHIACCNAGVCRLAPFEEMDDATRDFHIDVNIKGVWNTCKAVIPYMLKQGGGSIVIASSVTGDIVADAGEAAYAMTKAALVGLTKCLAVEYAGRNIRVNCSQLGYARRKDGDGIQSGKSGGSYCRYCGRGTDGPSCKAHRSGRAVCISGKRRVQLSDRLSDCDRRRQYFAGNHVHWNQLSGSIDGMFEAETSAQRR